ncbi:helix-turn-helix domain-containing protein [Streptobacillus moniliformis]|uniref:Helix-turn-helix domain protein n=1 Tax=Streptobacillus moniliformis (strain ATCC 14647 / DSM 12112 / NCTC 10651 / 9901) TaxID=519441 RepID=D1AYK0_STRM9|nr:helix-turn-helix transcriptional regulator [Streptobacillus moniliformis]ACZ01376.1 helix-turn-helix domain protein [Streptobacillus moniliformis DSM 12112]AVL43611.1 XRE family transcriptional regulator [Streptobacillus moniliformis]SQA13464.1 Helix-turn-helix [Streptobacillus moniliformis]
MKKSSNFKFRLKEALKIKNISQRMLALQTNLAPATIANYLNGRNSAKYENIEKISKVLNVDPQWLDGYDVPFSNLYANYSFTAEEKKYLDNWLNTNQLYFDSLNITSIDKENLKQAMIESFIRSLKNKDK